MTFDDGDLHQRAALDDATTGLTPNLVLSSVEVASATESLS